MWSGLTLGDTNGVACIGTSRAVPQSLTFCTSHQFLQTFPREIALGEWRRETAAECFLSVHSKSVLRLPRSVGNAEEEGRSPVLSGFF